MGPRRRNAAPRRAALAAAAVAVAVALLVSLRPAAAQEGGPPATGSNLGGVGLIEMRNARFRPDGTLEAGTAIRHQRRFHALTFQALPFLETTFRLAERLDATAGRGSVTDRAFDLKLRLLEETDARPAVAIGLQDFIGTGIYGGEYLVGSKRFGPLDVTLGLGWGRLGTGGDLGNPLRFASDGFERRPRAVEQGGSINALPFFRGGDTAVFGGLEYSLPPLPTPWGELEGLRAKLEWSGDALRDERGGWPASGGVAGSRGEARTRLNAGLQWSNEWLDVGLHAVHGTDLLFRISARLDPAHPPEAPRPPPPPMAPRPVAAPPTPGGAEAALRAAGFRPIAVDVSGMEARIAVADGRFRTLAQTAGRVARAVQPYLPAEVELLRLSWWRDGAEIARLLLPRTALEAAAGLHGGGSAEEVFASAMVLRPGGGDPPWEGGPTAMPGGDLAWGLEPRIALQLGDPNRTLLWQVQAAAGARLNLGAGVALAGSVAQPVIGNMDRAQPSASALPHVRSDAARYAAAPGPTIPALYVERLWSPARDLYARATAGLLEPMFAGVSAELLWRPHDRPYAIGMDVAQVAQRDHDGRFGTLGYSTTTGHLSVYGELPWWNLYGVVRAGRYLAGDWGATIEIGRRFDSGIEVGGFATFTDVPFETFGEGSFDKGIYVRVPLDLLGVGSRSTGTALIRPVLRDGGARLSVDSPLWEVTRDGRVDALERGYQGFVR